MSKEHELESFDPKVADSVGRHLPGGEITPPDVSSQEVTEPSCVDWDALLNSEEPTGEELDDEALLEVLWQMHEESWGPPIEGRVDLPREPSASDSTEPI